MKKTIASILILVFLFCAAGCNDQNNASFDYNYNAAETYSNSVTETGTANNQEQSLLPVNEDGVAVLYQDTAIDTVSGWEGENTFILVRKKIDETVPQVNLSSPIAVREYYEYFFFYPITSEPLYTIPFLFELSFKLNPLGGICNCFQGHYPTSDLISSGGYHHDILECNGMELEDFLNAHAEVVTLGSKGNYPAALISADKNEIFTFGGAATGKEWSELEVSADIEYYKLYNGNSIRCETTRNEKGYFVIDTTNLQKGLYYVSQINLLIEFV